jgi:hypothetical protein
MNVKSFLFMVISYILIRVYNHIFNSRPYLWQHAIFDGCIIFIYLLISLIPLWSKLWNKIFGKQ